MGKSDQLIFDGSLSSLLAQALVEGGKQIFNPENINLIDMQLGRYKQQFFFSFLIFFLWVEIICSVSNY